eukprot:TRINITY_DN668_c0_g1_i1.p1 TRINITY_DN668_c0_g1~~TRINITY_DN668_c0_g1_i1.p1  ORF type:complete len:736 (-),score=194.59 TRINITY_DN668_c0_g1_i1:272-2479(-)
MISRRINKNERAFDDLQRFCTDKIYNAGVTIFSVNTGDIPFVFWIKCGRIMVAGQKLRALKPGDSFGSEFLSNKPSSPFKVIAHTRVKLAVLSIAIARKEMKRRMLLGRMPSKSSGSLLPLNKTTYSEVPPSLEIKPTIRLQLGSSAEPYIDEIKAKSQTASSKKRKRSKKLKVDLLHSLANLSTTTFSKFVPKNSKLIPTLSSDDDYLASLKFTSITPKAQTPKDRIKNRPNTAIGLRDPVYSNVLPKDGENTRPGTSGSSNFFSRPNLHIVPIVQATNPSEPNTSITVKTNNGDNNNDFDEENNYPTMEDLIAESESKKYFQDPPSPLLHAENMGQFVFDPLIPLNENDDNTSEVKFTDVDALSPKVTSPFPNFPNEDFSVSSPTSIGSIPKLLSPKDKQHFDVRNQRKSRLSLLKEVHYKPSMAFSQSAQIRESSIQGMMSISNNVGNILLEECPDDAPKKFSVLGQEVSRIGKSKSTACISMPRTMAHGSLLSPQPSIASIPSPKRFVESSHDITDSLNKSHARDYPVSTFSSSAVPLINSSQVILRGANHINMNTNTRPISPAGSLNLSLIKTKLRNQPNSPKMGMVPQRVKGVCSIRIMTDEEEKQMISERPRSPPHHDQRDRLMGGLPHKSKSKVHDKLRAKLCSPIHGTMSLNGNMTNTPKKWSSDGLSLTSHEPFLQWASSSAKLSSTGPVSVASGNLQQQQQQQQPSLHHIPTPTNNNGGDDEVM